MLAVSNSVGCTSSGTAAIGRSHRGRGRVRHTVGFAGSRHSAAVCVDRWVSWCTGASWGRFPLLRRYRRAPSMPCTHRRSLPMRLFPPAVPRADFSAGTTPRVHHRTQPCPRHWCVVGCGHHARLTPTRGTRTPAWSRPLVIHRSPPNGHQALPEPASCGGHIRRLEAGRGGRAGERYWGTLSQMRGSGVATDFFFGGSLAPIGVTVSFLSATAGMNSIS